MNPFEFVIGVLLITTVGQIFRARAAQRGGACSPRPPRLLGLSLGLTRLGDDDVDGREPSAHRLADESENRRLREEMTALKERIHTLERIAVDKESSLAREIDQLRDR